MVAWARSAKEPMSDGGWAMMSGGRSLKRQYVNRTPVPSALAPPKWRLAEPQAYKRPQECQQIGEGHQSAPDGRLKRRVRTTATDLYRTGAAPIRGFGPGGGAGEPPATHRVADQAAQLQGHRDAARGALHFEQ